MSTFIYNNIELSITKTNSIERVPRMSDDGTDYLWTDFIIDISCIYGPGATSFPVQGVLPAETDSFIRSALLQPRAPLFFSEGGIPILDIPRNLINGGAIDCDNGPKPISCTVTRIGSSRLFFVRYAVKASIIECSAGAIVSAIASNRYARTESIDGQYRSTMTTMGRAYFRSNVLAALGTNADAFRGYIIPNAMTGYARKTIQVSIEPNGIVMDFIAVDVEQFIDLGSQSVPFSAGSTGIVEMDLEYSTSSVINGDIGFAGIAIRATASGVAIGQKTANTLNMMHFLLASLYNKLGVITDTGMPMGLSCTENIFKKIVTASLTYQTLPRPGLPPQAVDIPIGINGIVGVPVVTLPSTSGLNPYPPNSNATRGDLAYTLAVGAFGQACYANLTTVGLCDQTGAVPPDLNSYNGQCIGFPSVTIFQPYDLVQGDDFRIPGKQSFRGQNPNKTSYLSYNIRNDDETVSGLAQIATASNPGSSTSPGSPTPTPSPTQPSLGSNTNPLDPLYQQPDTSSAANPTSVIVQLYKPITRVTIQFICERYGCVPELPDPSPTLAGYALLKKNVSPVGMEVAADGTTPIYRISGCYMYAKTFPTNDYDTLPFAIPPYIQATPNPLLQVMQADYLDGIINNPVT